MSVRVNITKDLRGVTSRVNGMTKRGQYALVNQVHADSNLYAPKKIGNLRNQSTISTDGKQIVWHVRYAKRQYHNYGAKFTTPGTGPKWDSKALALHGSQWVKITKKAMK